MDLAIDASCPHTGRSRCCHQFIYSVHIYGSSKPRTQIVRKIYQECAGRVQSHLSTRQNSHPKPKTNPLKLKENRGEQNSSADPDTKITIWINGVKTCREL
jgi:hypothetical protein